MLAPRDCTRAPMVAVRAADTVGPPGVEPGLIGLSLQLTAQNPSVNSKAMRTASLCLNVMMPFLRTEEKKWPPRSTDSVDRWRPGWHGDCNRRNPVALRHRLSAALL